MTKNLNVGEVALDLSGEALVLRPTLRAAQAINRKFGSLADALRQVAALNLEAYTEIIKAGSGLKDAEQRELPERVFRAGVTRLSGPLAEFLSILLNGGRPVSPDDDLTAESPAEGNT